MIYGFLALVGFYALSCYLFENLRAPVLIFCASLRKLLGTERALSLKQRYGTWAVITGATDGIGKAYARELARQGLNIVLISRTEEKLQAVAANIESEFSVSVKWIVADFSLGREVYNHIETELENIPVGILVNNVGTNTSRLDIMSSFSADELWSVIHTNIAPVTILSRYFLHRMQDQSIKGLIVNISSGTELQPQPRSALYAASKVFTKSLTLALQVEARPFGITVQLVSPNFVVTKINSYSRFIMAGGYFIPTAEVYARWAVSTMGKLDETTGYFWHGLETAFLKILSPKMRIMLVTKVMNKLLLE